MSKAEWTDLDIVREAARRCGMADFERQLDLLERERTQAQTERDFWLEESIRGPHGQD